MLCLIFPLSCLNRIHSIFFMAWIAKLPIAMRKSHYSIRKDKLHEMLVHGWLLIPPSVINECPLDQHNLELILQSRSQIPGPEMEYTTLAIKLTAFGFWTGEPGFDILRINRGPQNPNRGPQIAIEALNSSSRSLKSSSRCWSRSLWHVSFVSLLSAAPRFVSALSPSSSQVCVCPFCVSRRENGLWFFLDFPLLVLPVA
jgi:hypothetical protein